MDSQVDYYCGCPYEFILDNATGNYKPTIIITECPYKSRKDNKQYKHIEYEHIVPKSHLKQNKRYSEFSKDLHNLIPVLAELNRDRGNRPYGIIAGEERKYGLCDFEVDFKADVVEVREDIRGDVARVWLYMSDKYKFDIPEEQLNIFLLWHRLDPPDDTERKRDKKIKELQGDSNPYIADSQ